MKPKGNSNQSSLFLKSNTNDKSMINNNIRSNLEQSKISSHAEDSLIILLKEENNASTSNNINELIFNAEKNPLMTVQRKSEVFQKIKNPLSSVNINERSQSGICPHQSNHKNRDNIFKFTQDKSRCIKIIDKIYDSSQEEESDFDKNQKFSVIQYNNCYKQLWDHFFIFYVIIMTIFISFIVSFTTNIPYIAIIGVLNLTVMTTEIVLRLITSYIDEDNNTIENSKLIAIHYIKSWFIIDILTWFPYNLCALEPSSSLNTEFNSIFDRDNTLLQKILSLVPLIQMLKILMKGQLHSRLKMILDLFRINSQIKRLIYFLFSFILMNHVVACFWFFTSNLQYFNPSCWVVRLGYIDKTIGELYLACYSWSLATITTIGFGNISAGTSIERIYSLIVMSFGVVMFSFAIGSLSSIVNISDRKTEEMTQKLQMLSLIEKEYKIDKETYQRIRASIKYDHNHNSLKDNDCFLQDLPARLSLELTKIMLDSKIKEINFFIQYPSLFPYIAPLLKSVQFIQRDVLYKQNDKIEEMYFISEGTISLCLGQEYNEKEIKMIKKHNNFGEIEMCIGEVLGYNIKVKSRTCNLFVLIKVEFLKLSLRFQETIEEFMQKSLMIHIRFKEKMKKMINKFQSKEDLCKDNIIDDSFSLDDKNDYRKDEELECIDENNEESMLEPDSQLTIKEESSSNGNSIFNSDDDGNSNSRNKQENGGKNSNNLSPINNSKSNINDDKNYHSEVNRLNDKFDTKLNKLIDFITINDIKFGNDRNSISPVDLLLQIQHPNQAIQQKNDMLLKVEKILSEAIF